MISYNELYLEEIRVMKKVLIIVLAVVLALLAGVAGYAWYINAHIFVEDGVYAKNAKELDLRGEDISFAHYETVKVQLPNCKIVWDVPFQNTKISSDSAEVSITSLTEEDIQLLTVYFPALQKIDASGCRDYPMLENLKTALPEIQVVELVDLGGKAIPSDSTEVTLATGEYDFAVMMENLKYLPELKTIHLPKSILSMEQMNELTAAFEHIQLVYTVEVLGKEYSSDTEELDLSGLTSADVEKAAEGLSRFGKEIKVELMSGESTGLTLEDVHKLSVAAPNAVIHYTFEFYGHTISTTDEEVILKNIKVENPETDLEGQLRQVLDLMENCKRFVLDSRQYDKIWRSINNEALAKIREDYRDRTLFVWRVFFGENGSSLTDAEVLRAVYGLMDDNCDPLQYLEEVRYMDLGHNEFLDYCNFVAGMPKLEVVILSGAPIKSLEPFANCKELKFLELSNCWYIPDLEPLRGCTELEMLNICYTEISDLSPLDELDLTHLQSKMNEVSNEEAERFVQLHPDCWSEFKGTQEFGEGWRSEGDNVPTLWYARLSKAFYYPNPYNNLGWYLPEELAAELAAAEAAEAQEELTEEVPEETTEETTPETTAEE